MAPRISFLSTTRTIAFRPKPATVQWRSEQVNRLPPALCRGFADSKDLPKAKRAEGPNTDTLPHVSEEAAAMSKIRGEKGADLEQGTPVEEVVKGDKEAQDKLPKVMQDSLKASSPKGTRSFSTSARSQALSMVEAPQTTPAVPGVKFGLPALPIPSDAHHRYRYDPVVKQVTNLLMRHGELSKAQRNMAHILTHLRTSSPPTINPARPLLPGAPPASHLPLNPVLYLTLAVDSIAPLLRIRSQRGAAGGGVALQIPVPLGLRQRRRTAIEWIINSASKKKTRGSGKYTFAQRVAEEIVSVVEGKSSIWERRNAIHKLGVSARANLNYLNKGPGRR